MFVQSTKQIQNNQTKNIDEMLNRFYMSRIGIRMLIGHYLSITKGYTNLIDLTVIHMK